MGETLHNVGELDSRLQLQAQIAEYTAYKASEELIPQQRQVSEEMMTIGRASREAFMKAELREMKIQNLVTQQRQHEEQRIFVTQSLESGDAKWYEYAKCKNSDADFFPDNIAEPVLKSMARAACSGCFVKSQCLQDELAQGLKNQYGIRGGTTPRERRAMLNNQLDAAS